MFAHGCALDGPLQRSSAEELGSRRNSLGPGEPVDDQLLDEREAQKTFLWCRLECALSHQHPVRQMGEHLWRGHAPPKRGRSGRQTVQSVEKLLPGARVR